MLSNTPTDLSSRYKFSLHPVLNFCKSSHTCNNLFNAGLPSCPPLNYKFHEDSIALSLERKPLDSFQSRDSGNRVVRLLNGETSLFSMAVTTATLEKVPLYSGPALFHQCNKQMISTHSVG